MKQVCVCARENFKVIRCRIPKVTLSQPTMCVTVCVCVCVRAPTKQDQIVIFELLDAQ